ncbi:MAG: ABC transporter ATP-binding protein [Dehalococcoidia bacterium]|nr:ABC transporter ATP-binding protein [Dehalococcoidia bacterium]
MPPLVRILSFLRPYKMRVALAWLCVLGAGAFVLATPQLIRWAIDTGLDVQIKNLNGNETHVALGNTRTLVIAASAIIAAALLRGAFAYGQTYLAEWVSQWVAYDLRNAIFERLERLSHAYHDQAQTGQLMSRATQDVEAMRLYISFGVLRMIYLLVVLLMVFSIMLISDWSLTLVAWALLPVVIWRSRVMTAQLSPIWMKVQDGLGRLGAVMQENFSGVRVVRAFSREEYESRKFAREAEDLFGHSYLTTQISAFNAPMMTGLWMLAMVATIWFGGWQITQGRMEIGELTSFMLYLTILQVPIRALGWIVMLFARAASAAERIYEILDAESAVKEKPGAVELKDVEGLVRFEGVSFGYDAVSPLLHDVSFEARPNEVVALLGPTGSGKTTVVSLIPRFYDVTSGRITIDGHDIRDLTLASLRRNVGIVQQDVFLFSATIRENIAYGAVSASQEEIEAASRTARIHDVIARLPEGYDTWVGERGVTLSGGEKQRIAIARTLLMDPRILILDDSTSSVDTETEYLIQQALAELMRGRTTFVIAQRLRTVKNAHQILVLREGRIVERGRHHELLRRDGFYRQIYDLELRDQEEALARTRREEELHPAFEEKTT